MRGTLRVAAGQRRTGNGKAFFGLDDDDVVLHGPSFARDLAKAKGLPPSWAGLGPRRGLARRGVDRRGRQGRGVFEQAEDGLGEMPEKKMPRVSAPMVKRVSGATLIGVVSPGSCQYMAATMRR